MELKIRQANLEDIKAIKKLADLFYVEMPDFVWNKKEFIEKQIEKGIGSRLVEFAKQFAKENNFKILRTTSFYEYGGHKFHCLETEV